MRPVLSRALPSPSPRGQVTARGTRWPLQCHWNATRLPLALSPKAVEKEGKRCCSQGAQGEHPRTPPGRSCWECRGSGTLLLPSPAPQIKSNQTWRSGSVGAAPGSSGKRWEFGAEELLSGELCAPALRGLAGNPSWELGWARPELGGIWEGMRGTWDVPNPQPRSGIVTAQAWHRRPCLDTRILGWKN